MIDTSQFFLIAGPCVIEGRDFLMRHAEALKEITSSVGVPFIFKSSWEKANRQSHGAFRGLGLERGLSILAEVKKEFSLDICTDIHETAQASIVAEVASVIQIPALLCRQSDILTAAGLTGKIVEIKRGQMMSPWQMKGAVEKVRITGNKQIWLTERGFAFGYGDLVTDMRAFPIMKSFCETVLYDCSHSQQQPGATGSGSGGQRQFAEPLARAALAAGADGIFCEVHEAPERALSDGATQLRLAEFPGFLRRLVELWSAMRSAERSEEQFSRPAA